MNTDGPLLRYEEMSRGAWRRFRPTTDGPMVAVSEDRQGRLQLMDRRPSASEVFYSPPTGVYWVDVSVHHAGARIKLPTAEGVFHFVADLDLAWRIGDPVQAVRDKLRDGEYIYRPYLEHQLRSISRKFEVNRFAEAEQHLNIFADRTTELPCGIVLLDWKVKLSPESSTQSHIQERTYDIHRKERREAEHDGLQHAATLRHRETEVEHRLALQQESFRQELAKLEEQHRLDLEKLRMQFYSDALQTGELGAIALRLASNREDVNEVIQLFMREKQLDFTAASEMLNALLEQRLVNRRDVQDILQQTTGVIADRLHQNAPGAVASVKHAQQLTASVEDAEVVSEPDDEDDHV
ncbi:hypothetical protein IRT45_24300 [Nocardia sp. BSTN01]|uniref:hypothetical protein n=1 Tax=Nocardia sp. BSTN01 TaxID=2783665 RepID=UPI00188DEBDF|nr:hypothetical protein [Nocardia sp. BSTN01]MBF5000271.1 hypothetical protein [Nocardia sp. BSTN01]